MRTWALLAVGAVLALTAYAAGDEPEKHEYPWNVGATCGDESALVSWNPVNDTTNLSGYGVFRGTSASGPWTDLTPSLIATTSYADSGLAPSTTYYWFVRAVYVDEHYADSSVASCTTG